MAAIVDKSLLRFTDERYWMLETIREYAAERLVQLGEAEAIRNRYAQFFLHLTETVASELSGLPQATRLNELIAELDNLSGTRALLAFSVLDAEGNLVYFNKAAGEMHGITFEDAGAGPPAARLFHEPAEERI